MLSVKTVGNKTIIRQIPVILYLASGILTIPIIISGLVSLAQQTDSGGGTFSLLFGIALGWLMFEFVATWEEIIIDLDAREFRRKERGIFRVKELHVKLRAIDKVLLEKLRPRGRLRYHILLKGPSEEHLINNPSIVYLDHPKLAALISETLNLPLEEAEVAGMKWR